LCGSVWFNYHFVGGSYFLNGVILIMFLFWVLPFNTEKYYLDDERKKEGIR
jgi:hypothetical protein